MTFGSSCTVIFDQVRKARAHSTLYQCKLVVVFFLFRTISSREARPVISAMINTPFLIDRNKSVQLGGFLRAQALKSLFFGYFLLGRKESNSARRANTARMRAIAKEGYGKGGFYDCARDSVSSKVAIAARPLCGRTATFHRR